MEVVAINFTLKKDDDGEPRLYVRTPDVAEALHYEHVDFELKTTNKMIRVAAKFKEARNEKKWKLYDLLWEKSPFLPSCLIKRGRSE